MNNKKKINEYVNYQYNIYISINNRKMYKPFSGADTTTSVFFFGLLFFFCFPLFDLLFADMSSSFSGLTSNVLFPIVVERSFSK